MYKSILETVLANDSGDPGKLLDEKIGSNISSTVSLEDSELL
jgi:hypothetical protein